MPVHCTLMIVLWLLHGCFPTRMLVLQRCLFYILYWIISLHNMDTCPKQISVLKWCPMPACPTWMHSNKNACLTRMPFLHRCIHYMDACVIRMHVVVHVCLFYMFACPTCLLVLQVCMFYMFACPHVCLFYMFACPTGVVDASPTWWQLLVQWCLAYMYSYLFYVDFSFSAFE